jgi:hypothetical protein
MSSVDHDSHFTMLDLARGCILAIDRRRAQELDGYYVNIRIILVSNYLALYAFSSDPRLSSAPVCNSRFSAAEPKNKGHLIA